MPVPPLPPALDTLGPRPFSFYPPILNIEHNEWRYGRATWSEVLVVNSHSGLEVWIPRRFMGEISSVDEPVVIVGLRKELEYQGGAVWPHERRLIEMPLAVNDRPHVGAAPPESAPRPARVVGIRLESRNESRVGRLVGSVLVIGVVVCVGLVTFFRQGEPRPRVIYSGQDQTYLDLTRQDDYFDVVRKLGSPSGDRWQSESGELQYRALWYPKRAYYVILMGTERNNARYIGTLDKDWNLTHSVRFPMGGSTDSLLRRLRPF
ncbi:MAG: hypothetical protein WD696_02565 [Bryobacteraceae bacterium]